VIACCGDLPLRPGYSLCASAHSVKYRLPRAVTDGTVNLGIEISILFIALRCQLFIFYFNHVNTATCASSPSDKQCTPLKVMRPIPGFSIDIFLCVLAHGTMWMKVG
jgi:hypothetical protein